MKSIKLSILIFLYTFSANAQNNNPLAGIKLNDTTYYNVMKKAFSEAQVLEHESIVGRRSGRCYTKDQPNTPISTFVSGIKVDYGPGFTTPVSYRAAFIWYSDVDPDYFDSGPIRWQIEFLIYNNYMNGPPLVQEDASLAMYFSPNKIKVRKGSVTLGSKNYKPYDAYFLVEMTNVDKEQATEAFQYCYYFKKTRNAPAFFHFKF